MEIVYSKNKNVAIININGHFDYGDDKHLVDTAASIANQSLSAIAIDVSKLESINSIGIASLYSIMKIADEVGCEYVIFGLNQKLTSILGKVFINNYVPLLTEEDFKIKYLS